MNDKELIEENAHYMLGMYDLYQNDQEIVQALKLKGLSASIIQQILARIKEPSYIKRAQQAKRNIIIGSLLLLFFFILPYALIRLLGGSFSDYRNGVENDKDVPEMMKIILRFYFQFYIFFVFAFVAQIINGIIRFRKYKKLLGENSGK